MKAREYKIQPQKTYANEDNARKAVEKMMVKYEAIKDMSDLTFSIVWNQEGRCFPVFFGCSSLQAGVAFQGFNVVAFS